MCGIGILDMLKFMGLVRHHLASSHMLIPLHFRTFWTSTCPMKCLQNKVKLVFQIVNIIDGETNTPAMHRGGHKRTQEFVSVRVLSWSIGLRKKSLISITRGRYWLLLCEHSTRT